MQNPQSGVYTKSVVFPAKNIKRAIKKALSYNYGDIATINTLIPKGD